MKDIGKERVLSQDIKHLGQVDKRHDRQTKHQPQEYLHKHNDTKLMPWASPMQCNQQKDTEKAPLANRLEDVLVSCGKKLKQSSQQDSKQSQSDAETQLILPLQDEAGTQYSHTMCAVRNKAHRSNHQENRNMVEDLESTKTAFGITQEIPPPRVVEMLDKRVPRINFKNIE